MNIVVIGGGIYGCTISLRLEESGHRVTLLEKEDDILKGASFISRRSHRGYFYARSAETLLDCKTYAPLFEKRYKEAVITDIATYYAIAREGSKLSFAQFVSSLEQHRLPYVQKRSPLLNPDTVEGTLLVREHCFDPLVLRRLLRRCLAESTVQLLLNTDARRHSLRQYDLKIVCAYADTRPVTALFQDDGMTTPEYRLCEKVVVALPAVFHRTSFVVADGPFFQLEPSGMRGNTFVVSHFFYSMHQKGTSDAFSVPVRTQRFLGKGVVTDRKGTRFLDIRDAISAFLPKFKTARYVGSIYAVKPILAPGPEDRRPVVVWPIRSDVLVAFSGKVSGSIKAAEECLAYVERFKAKTHATAAASRRRTASTAI